VASFNRGEFAFAQQYRSQGLAVDVLHCDELDAIRFSQIEDSDDVAMSHLASENQLLLEAMQNFGAKAKLGLIVFKALSDPARGPRLVNGPISALTEELQNLIPVSQHPSGLEPFRRDCVNWSRRL